MFICTIPKNIFNNSRRLLDSLDDGVIGSAFLENKILREYITQEVKSSAISAEDFSTKVLAVQLKFYSNEFNLLRKSEELDRILKGANCLQLNYSIHTTGDNYNFQLFSRVVMYNYDRFPRKSFFYDSPTSINKYYDSRAFQFKEDFNKVSVNFKTGNIIRNILDFRYYYIAKDPKLHSVFECLIPCDPHASNKYHVYSWAHFILIDDNRYSNILEFNNKKAREITRVKEKNNNDS